VREEVPLIQGEEDPDKQDCGIWKRRMDKKNYERKMEPEQQQVDRQEAERILNSDVVSRKFFFPRKAEEGLEEQSLRRVIPCKDGTELVCYYHNEKRHPHPKTLVHFHGNGELALSHVNCLDDPIPSIFSCLKDLQLNVLFVEYRGYNASTGKPQLLAMLEDVGDILAALSLPPEDIIAYGRSLGSVFAIEMAYVQPQIGGVIVESGLSDMFPVMSKRLSPEELSISTEQFRQILHQYCDQQEKWESYKGRVLLLHCEDDTLVPIRNAEENFARAGGDQKKLVRFEAGEHQYIWPMNWKKYSEEIAAFVKEVGHEPIPLKKRRTCVTC